MEGLGLALAFAILKALEANDAKEREAMETPPPRAEDETPTTDGPTPPAEDDTDSLDWQSAWDDAQRVYREQKASQNGHRPLPPPDEGSADEDEPTPDAFKKFFKDLDPAWFQKTVEAALVTVGIVGVSGAELSTGAAAVVTGLETYGIAFLIFL